MPLSGYLIGIDFGTSNTVGVLRYPDGRSESLLFDGSPMLLSGVCLDENGQFLTGRDAAHVARTRPEAFEPNPKRRIDDGTVLLGGHDVPVPQLLAAVLSRVMTEARRATGRPPERVVLTHPVAWGPRRLNLLRQAAAIAGIPAALLVPEPVAAAYSFVALPRVNVAVGQSMVVYDFGGGTFDATVMRRTPLGFDVVAYQGLDDVGGLDIDAAIVDHLGAVIGHRAPAVWQRLHAPASGPDRRASRLLWEDVRQAKETLSRTTSVHIHVPLLDDDLPLGREQLEALARPLLNQTVGTSLEALRAAETPAGGVAAVLLVGGSSRIPLASTLLHQHLGIAPTVVENPELVVAQGSIIVGAAAQLAPPVPPPGPVPGRPGRSSGGVGPVPGEHGSGAHPSGAGTGARSSGADLWGSSGSASGAPGSEAGADLWSGSGAGAGASGGVSGVPASGGGAGAHSPASGAGAHSPASGAGAHSPAGGSVPPPRPPIIARPGGVAPGAPGAGVPGAHGAHSPGPVGAGVPGAPTVVLPPKKRGAGRTLAIIAGAVALVLVVCGGLFIRGLLAASTGAEVGNEAGERYAGGPVCPGELAFLGAATGTGAEQGLRIQRGVELAVTEYNEQSADCDVTLTTFDTAGDDKKAAELATNVTQNAATVGVIGPLRPAELNEAGKIYDEAGIAQITPVGDAAALASWKTFHQVIGDEDSPNLVARSYLLDRLRATKVYVTDDGSDHGRKLTEYIRAGLDEAKATVGSESLSKDPGAMAKSVELIRRSGASAVLYVGAPALGGQLRKALTEAGSGDVQLVGTSDLDDPAFFREAGEAAQGTLLFAPYMPTKEFPATFTTAYQAQFGEEPGRFSAEAYDAAKILLDGIAAGKQDRASMLDFVNKYDADGVTKHLKFNELGDLATPTMWVYQAGQNAFTSTGRLTP